MIFQPSSQTLQMFLHRITRKMCTLSKYQIWKNLQPIVLNCIPLKKSQKNLPTGPKEHLKTQAVHYSDMENENALKNTYKHTDACANLIRIRTKWFFCKLSLMTYAFSLNKMEGSKHYLILA